MTQNDNFKYYYGQSLINKDTVSEYESIMDYIKANGGKGSGIDADMLDGYESGDFLLLKDRDLYMSPGFYIGYTAIQNSTDAGDQFLYTRDIRLNGEYKYMFNKPGENGGLKVDDFYMEMLGRNGTSEIAISKATYNGDWDRDHIDKLLSAGLSDIELAIECLSKYGYNTKTELNDRINELSESMLNDEEFNKVKYILDNYLVNFRVYDSEGNLTNNTEQVLDAGAVNGLRFFLVTQQQYDRYPNAIKKNSHYIFIIKDEVPEGYVTPTTISASSFKLKFKTDDGHVMVSIDNGLTYMDAGNLYQFSDEDEGLLPMYIDGESLPTILADPSALGDNFFINGAWMREFLGRDPSTTDTLQDIIDNQIDTLRDKVATIESQLSNFDENYEVKSNKTGDLVDSDEKYPNSAVVNAAIGDLQAQIEMLNEKIGDIDSILHAILDTGTG